MKLKTIDQNGVKDFYEIEDWQQCELLIDLIELIGSNNVSSLEKLSKKKGEAPQQIWANICKSRGIELCTIPERILMAVPIADIDETQFAFSSGGFCQLPSSAPGLGQ